MKARRAGNTDKGFEGFCYKKNKDCCSPLATKEVSERFFREAGFLLGCAVKPTGYSEVAVQGLSSLLEQNMKR